MFCNKCGEKVIEEVKQIDILQLNENNVEEVNNVLEQLEQEDLKVNKLEKIEKYNSVVLISIGIIVVILIIISNLNTKKEVSNVSGSPDANELVQKLIVPTMSPEEKQKQASVLVEEAKKAFDEKDYTKAYEKIVNAKLLVTNDEIVQLSKLYLESYNKYKADTYVKDAKNDLDKKNYSEAIRKIDLAVELNKSEEIKKLASEYRNIQEKDMQKKIEEEKRRLAEEQRKGKKKIRRGKNRNDKAGSIRFFMGET